MSYLPTERRHGAGLVVNIVIVGLKLRYLYILTYGMKILYYSVLDLLLSHFLPSLILRLTAMSKPPPKETGRKKKQKKRGQRIAQ